jgi:hypothetical protein
MAPIRIDPDGIVYARCPKCSGFRKYSSVPRARHAIKTNRLCYSCSNAQKRHAKKTFGFSDSEINSIKVAALTRGWFFVVEAQDLQDLWNRQGGKCALSGIPMQKAPRTWSIDRVDNSCGYWPDNIQLVLKHVNMMRGSLTIDRFIETCKFIAAHRSKHDDEIPA